MHTVRGEVQTVASQLWNLLHQPALRWSCRLHSSNTRGIIWIKPLFLQDTTVCVWVCVHMNTCVCWRVHITRKNAERKVRGSEGKHPICYNFAWAVPVSKYRDNIFLKQRSKDIWSDSWVNKGKIFEIGNIWDNLRCVATIILRAPGNHGVLLKHFEILAY